MVLPLTDISSVRSFKAILFRQFGPALHLVWQQIIVLLIIEAYIQAREVIPQPKPQPSLSQETRRCRQSHRRAVLRANLFSFSRYVHKERSDKSKPHCVARGRNRITFSNEKTRAAVAQSSREVFAVNATAAFALIFERTCFVNISGDFPSSGL